MKVSREFTTEVCHITYLYPKLGDYLGGIGMYVCPLGVWFEVGTCDGN